MSLQKIAEMKKEYLKKVEEDGKQLVLAELKESFAKFPRLQAVRWTQYTPHFNDGDVCSFGVHEPEFKISDYEVYYPKYTRGYYDDIARKYVHSVRIEGEYEAEPDKGERDDGFLYNYVPSEAKILNPLTTKEKDILNDLEAVITDNDDIMEIVFGDGYQITITRDCIVTKEEYDHD
jgi:hypothetical protein